MFDLDPSAYSKVNVNSLPSSPINSKPWKCLGSTRNGVALLPSNGKRVSATKFGVWEFKDDNLELRISISKNSDNLAAAVWAASTFPEERSNME